MQRRQALPVAAAAFALIASPMAETASADPPEFITGTVQFKIQAPTSQPEVKGKVTRFSVSDRSRIFGDVLFTPAGAADAQTDYQCRMVAGETTFDCRGQGSGMATVAGVGTGELTSRLSLTCTPVAPTAALCQGRIRIDGVSGGIDGVHAAGTFENTAVGQSTYTLRLHRP